MLLWPLEEPQYHLRLHADPGRVWGRRMWGGSVGGRRRERGRDINTAAHLRMLSIVLISATPRREHH